MIKYKVTIGEVTTELECQTIGELIEYLNYDKEDQEESRIVVETDRFVVKSNEPLVWNDGEWIEWTWTEEKPYPETLETKVYVKFQDGEDDTHNNAPETVKFWKDGLTSKWQKANLFDSGALITHYKLA